MNLDPLASALSRIGNLIASITKKTVNSSVEEILELVDNFGGAAEQQVFLSIIQQFEWTPTTSDFRHFTSTSKDKESSSCSNLVCRESSTAVLSAFIAEYTQRVLPSRVTAGLGQAILQSQLLVKASSVSHRPSSTSHHSSSGVFSSLVRLGLRLSRTQEACLLLYLLCNASHPDHRAELSTLVATRLPVLLQGYGLSSSTTSGGSSSSDSDLTNIPIECLHKLVIGLREGCPLPINKSLLATLSTSTTSSSPSSQLSLTSSSLTASIATQFASSSTATSSSASSGGVPPAVAGASSASSTASLTSVVVAGDVLKAFLKTLQAEFPAGGEPAVLSPLLYPYNSVLAPPSSCSPQLLFGHQTDAGTHTSSMSDTLLPELLLELGATNNSSVEECRSNLSSLNRSAFTASAVARFIAGVVRAHQTAPPGRLGNEQIGLQNLSNPSSLWNDKKDKGSGRNDSSATNSGGGGGGAGGAIWNIDAVIQAIMELAPTPIQTKDVILKLDHKSFLITDRLGLSVFVTATRRLCNAYARADHYPVECLYRKWQHLDEQVLLLSTMLNNPDIFCFTDYPCMPVTVEMLKTVPELENKEVATWRSMNLIELLLSLEVTHYNAVKSLFALSRQNCPDVLMLALVQSTGGGGAGGAPLSMLKQELLSQLVPVFLEPHPNTGAVLHTAWFTQNNRIAIRQLILLSMSDWYMQQENDQSRLSRILDVAQDLKALSMLLNAQPFPFVIDLACLAFRREFLKLDKWLNDKVHEHGEVFLSALVKFVQQRCPQLAGGGAGVEDTASSAPQPPLPKASQLPPETLTTIVQCLNAFMRSVMNHELSESILTISQNSSLLAINRQRTSNINSLLGFPAQDTLSGLSSGLGGLSLTTGGNSSGGGGVAPPTPSTSAAGTPVVFRTGSGALTSAGLASSLAGNLGALGSAGVSVLAGALPGSPSRGPLGVVAEAQQQQAAAPSMIAPPPQHQPAIGSQIAPQPGIMDISSLFELPAVVSKEVDDEANSFFQRIYNNPPHSTLTIKEMLELLKKFRDSGVKKEKEVYACMLRNLFEEYKFFPTYPEKELFITAKLYGGIIDQGLVEYLALGYALRNVIEALQKPLNSNMYFFGILALDSFRSRLKDYPRYSSYIVNLDNFAHFPPHLAEWVRYSTQAQEPPARPSGPVLPEHLEHLDPSNSVNGNSSNAAAISAAVFHQPSSVLPPLQHANSLVSQRMTGTNIGGVCVANSAGVKLGGPGAVTTAPITRPQSAVAATVTAAKPSITTTDINTLLVASEEKATTLRQPTEQQNDKIAFIFNNLSQVNLPHKSDELLEVVTEDCWPWVAQYLVLKRASIEANFHNLYSNFLDHLKHSTFTKMVIDETLRNIKVLLKADKTRANFSDKSLLKNLGHWLGLLTIAKNKPILHIDINFKSLLIEAFLKGTQEMQYVVPFVTKVLESCGKSKVFKPPNPWTMSLMNVLAEVHGLQDTKLHLKFEIEVLCNKLVITVDSLKPKNVLLEASAMKIKEFQLGPSNSFVPHNAVPQTPTGDAMSEAVAAAIGRDKRAESTPLLPSMPNFPNQSFLAGAGGLVTDGVGLTNVSGQGSSSAGATPTPQTPHSQQPSHTTPHSTPTPAHHLHATPIAATVAQVSSGSATPGPALAAMLPPTEKSFTYAEVNVTTLRGLEQHISLNNIPMLSDLTNQTQIKNLIRLAIEATVTDERCALEMNRNIRVTISTVETLVKKDFALDPDENHMRAAAHYMARNLTASMIMIKCKDLLVSIFPLCIKQKLAPTFLRGSNIAQEQQIEQLSNAIAAENLQITCAYIQKTCAEKAVLEIDKLLAPEFEARKAARAENRHYCSTAALTYQAERMPDQMRLKVGRVTHQQMQVYEDFGRHIPGFAPTLDLDNAVSLLPKATARVYSNEEPSAFLLLTERFLLDIEHVVQAFNTVTPDSPVSAMLHTLYTTLVHIRTTRDFHTIPLLLRKCMEHLLEGTRELPTDPELGPLVLKFRDLHLVLLKTIADPRVYGAAWTTKTVTKLWSEMRDDVKHSLEVVDWLLRSSLINVPLFDEHLARSLEDPRAQQAHFFAMQIVQMYLIEEGNQGVLNESDFPQTLEVMIRLCQVRQAPESLLNLLEALRIKHDMAAAVAAAGDRSNSAAAAAAAAAVVAASGQSSVSVTAPLAAAAAAGQPSTAALTMNAVVAANPQPNALAPNTSHSDHFHSGVNQARDFNDPPGLQEKTEVLLREWINLYHSPSAGPGSSTAFGHFVKQMNLHGILKTDELITRFFRNCVSFCREICIRSMNEQQQNQPHPAGSSQIPTTAQAAVSISHYRNKCFQHVDPFVRLVALLIKHSGEATNSNTKINLLNKVLGLVCGIMIHDIESIGSDFYQLPYHRILIMLFLELTAPEPVLESINLPVLMAFTQTLHLLRPSKCAGFAYAWLEIVSHRAFIGRMLALTQLKGWAMYSMLLTDLFRFLAPYLRNTDLAPPLTKLYTGTLRVLLVLLHDFPEFLCEYHYGFCDAIPPNCIQMRNLILSAYPRNMSLPDPFTPNLKPDMLPEIAVSPKIHCTVASYITPVELRNNLDSYLKNRTPVTFLTELRGYLQAGPRNSLTMGGSSGGAGEDGMRYNIPSLNALVLYVGMQAIAHIQSKGQTPSTSTIAHSAHMDIFQNLAVDMDTEGRYLFLNAIANQLRYPNSHTNYFSCTLLYLFAEANTEAIKEQITRVLFERVIVNRPHPWGLLITFMELFRNPIYKFWSHEFVKCAPEIEKLLRNVARSCMVNKMPASTGGAVGPREVEA